MHSCTINLSATPDIHRSRWGTETSSISALKWNELENDPSKVDTALTDFLVRDLTAGPRPCPEGLSDNLEENLEADLGSILCQVKE